MAENMTNPMTRHADEVTLRTTEEKWQGDIGLADLPEYIDAMKADIGTLLAAHAALAAKCERLEGLLRVCEQQTTQCLICREHYNHKPNCRLAAALAPQPEGDKT